VKTGAIRVVAEARLNAMLTWIGSTRPSGSSLLFLDRDGVINVDSPHYIKSWSEFTFYPDALEALRRCRQLSIPVVLISNQSGIHRGIIDPSEFWTMHHEMVRGIREAGGDLLAAFYCPHRPEEGCGCRKPLPGLLRAAADLYRVHPGHTCFVGDKISDIQAAVASGSKPVLLERFPKGEVDWLRHGLPGSPARISSLRGVESLFDP
jgi:D-glycero-D-manno-heptose 1,7-bisphosphate phosphatase